MLDPHRDGRLSGSVLHPSIRFTGTHVFRTDVDGASTEYLHWRAFAIFLLITFVIALPVGLAAWVVVHRKQVLAREEHFTKIWGNLFQPYKGNAFVWQAVVLVRRTTLVGLSTIADSLSRGMALTFINVTFLLAHLLILPYAQDSFNYMETCSLFLLTLLSSVVARYTPPFDDSVQVGIFMLVGFPAILMALAIVYIKVSTSQSQERCCL